MAIEAITSADLDAAREQERAAVVAWLRGMAPRSVDALRHGEITLEDGEHHIFLAEMVVHRLMADLIESGDHLQPRKD